MSHIHTAPGQHDFTASAFIVRLDQGRPKIMLHRHRLLKQLLQFGGHVELDENIWQALSREVLEESGYQLSQLKLLQPPIRLAKVTDAVAHPLPLSINTHKFPGQDHYHGDIAYAFVTREAPQHKVGVGESSEIRLLSAEDIVKLTSQQIPLNVKEICLFLLSQVLGAWEEVDPSQFKEALI